MLKIFVILLFNEVVVVLNWISNRISYKYKKYNKKKIRWKFTSKKENYRKVLDNEIITQEKDNHEINITSRWSIRYTGKLLSIWNII